MPRGTLENKTIWPIHELDLNSITLSNDILQSRLFHFILLQNISMPYTFLSSNINLYFSPKILTIYFSIIKMNEIPRKKLIVPQIHKGFSNKCPFQSALWEMNVILNWVILKLQESVKHVTYITSRLRKCDPKISPLQLTICDCFLSKTHFILLCHARYKEHNTLMGRDDFNYIMQRMYIYFLCMTQDIEKQE